MNLPLDQQNIINILGIESLPDERKAALVEKMSELIQKRLLVRILGSLTDEQVEEFQELLEKNNQADTDAFITQNVPDLGEWLIEETNQIKKELADLVQKE